MQLWKVHSGRLDRTDSVSPRISADTLSLSVNSCSMPSRSAPSKRCTRPSPVNRLGVVVTGRVGATLDGSRPPLLDPIFWSRGNYASPNRLSERFTDSLARRWHMMEKNLERAMQMRRRYRGPLVAAIHETAQGLRSAGVMDKQTMREFDELCLDALTSAEAPGIRALRSAEAPAGRRSLAIST